MFQYQQPKMPHFQIDPDQRPVFKILQPINDAWHEVGYVWTEGKSRTSSTEHWYLYTSVPADNPARLAPYAWAGHDPKGQIVGTTLRLDPVATPADQSPATFQQYLERQNGVSLTYVKGDMSGG